MTPDDSPAERANGRGALGLILVATVVAGAVGYLIQAVVPGFLDAADYAAFGAFWAVTYLLVSALSGLQQELTRVSHAEVPNDTRARWPLAARFTLIAAVIAGTVVVAVAVPLHDVLFGAGTASLAIALAVAVFGYTLVAGLSAALYGVQYWPGVAAMTVADSLIRLVLIVSALLFGFGITALGWAIALPFTIAVMILLFVVGRRVKSQLRVDGTMGTLTTGSLSTVTAALATGVLISGLPFLLRASSGAVDVTLVASLMLVITLTRAPLVVPVMALQSFLIVQFRAKPQRARATALRYAAVLLLASVALAALAAFVGPWLLELFYRDKYVVSALDFAIIVLSAGLTAAMCITAPAVLALGKHKAFVGGWALAAAITIAALFIPLGDWHARVLIAIVVAPTIGAIFHLIALRKRETA